jgi:hypothetical protein
MTTTNNGSDVHLKEKKTTASKQNGNIRSDNMNETSTPTTTTTTNSTVEETTSGETATTTTKKPEESSIEHAFFFGLTIDAAVNSTDNFMELFYNACKYNHLELVKRCVEEKHVNVNEAFNNDYPLCIAR